MVAALACAFFSFGAVLDVVTIIVLSKPEALFQPQPSASSPATSP